MENNKKNPQHPPQKEPPASQVLWTIAFGFMAIYFVSVLFSQQYQPVAYSEFKQRISQEDISEITIKGNQITGEFKDKIEIDTGNQSTEISYFKTIVPSFGDPELLSLLEEHNVRIRTESDETSWFSSLFIYLLPWILIIGFFMYSSRQFQKRMGGGNGIFGFGKSKSHLFDRSSSDIRFKHVAGLENAKQELEEIVMFLKSPEKFTRMGGKLPKGILLSGPPGTGKTLLARAAAGEAEVPFYSISGSEFIEMFVGVGASRVRDMFERAKKEAPTIIFIDELDSIGRARGTGLGGGHDEREQTLNQILSEMDGFSPHESIVVIAATNRPDVLDPALVRPGRFDRNITLELPDKKAREKILSIHITSEHVPVADSVDLSTIAGMTVGFSGADLRNVVNEAAIIAVRDGKEIVDEDVFNKAVDKIRMGPEREDFISENDKKIIAYHEAGHALMAKLLKGADPLNKVTIIPHGQALGVTEQIPEEDRRNLSRNYLLNHITILMGGRVAEKIVFDDISSGGGSDLKHATDMARRMVCQWGMSDKIGPVTFPLGEKHPFLGKEISAPKNYSDETAHHIDQEIKSIIEGREARAEEILSAHQTDLKNIAEALIERETLFDAEIERILKNQ